MIDMTTTLTPRIGHPSEIIDPELIQKIRSVAYEAEAQRCLHNDQLQIIHQEKWLKMFVPGAYGGLELSIPRILRTEECLAWADGSIAWVVTLCSGAAWFVGFLQPDLSAQVFADDHACFAGSGAATGIARITPDGYEVEGRWKYASGSLHATVFTANCLIYDGGKQLYHPDGTPQVRSFLFMKDEVTVHPTWNSMGMIATGSHTFEVKKLRVSISRSFVIEASRATLKHPLYQYPFLQLAETTLTVNLAGMAMRFFDLCENLLADKSRSHRMGSQAPDLIRMLSEARADLHEHRQKFYEAADASWAYCVSGSGIPGDILERVSDTSHGLAQRSRVLVDQLYPYCGLAAADVSQEINRVWRDLHTASQHALFASR